MDALLQNQTFTDTNLKNVLLSNLDPNPKSDFQKQMNSFLIERVNTFWQDVVEPLRTNGAFDGNKIKWYYDIYREGLESRKLVANPFTMVQIDRQTITNIVAFYNGKELSEYVNLGSSFLMATQNVLLGWYTSQQLIFRMSTFYTSERPVDWIRAMEAQGNTKIEGNEIISGVNNIINNISYILSKRI